MVDEIERKFSCKVFSQTLKKDCLEKLVIPEIVSIIGEEKTKATSDKLFSKMNINEISLALESLDEISNYNKDFTQLKLEYFSLKGKIANIFNFGEYVKHSHSGYYYKKALFFFALKVILIITGLYITFSLDFQKMFVLKFHLIQKQIKLIGFTTIKNIK